MSCDFMALANEGVRQLHPYLPGKPISELERELGITGIIKLASNENPLPLPDSVRDAMVAEMAELSRYPDANGYYLKEALSQRLGITSDMITLGNGSNDVLELIARVFLNGQTNAIFSEHAFLVYPIVTQSTGAQAKVVPAVDYGHDLDEMIAAIDDKTRVLFIANPNNPTGTYIKSAVLKKALKRVPAHVIVVVDEAYNEYVSEAIDTHAWVAEMPNLVVTRTFSKAYGLAGLRCGFAVSSPEVCGLMNRLRQPFNTNNFAQAAAQAVLKDPDYLNKAVSVNKEGLAQLTRCFDQLGLDYIPSSGNFITLDVGGPAAGVYQSLLKKGVIVRPIANYGMPNHLRISVGLAEENQKFIDALPTCLNHQEK